MEHYGRDEASNRTNQHNAQASRNADVELWLEIGNHCHSAADRTLSSLAEVDNSGVDDTILTPPSFS